MIVNHSVRPGRCCAAAAGHTVAVGFLDRLARLRDVEVVHVDAATEAEAWRWLRRHGEREYSFVHATSFAVMRRRRIRQVLVFDVRFQRRQVRRGPTGVRAPQRA